jgi:hypothetical protein
LNGLGYAAPGFTTRGFFMGTTQWSYSEQLTPPVGQDEMMDGLKGLRSRILQKRKPDPIYNPVPSALFANATLTVADRAMGAIQNPPPTDACQVHALESESVQSAVDTPPG